MFLETLDVRTNDIVLFSRNQFDFKKNFWIVFKNKQNKIPANINYFDVCEIFKNNSPKNIIVYRLLTNVPRIDASSSKYGYFVQIEGNLEIIYFDPVFALKDLNYLGFDLDMNKFRFKIQQLGLTSLMRRSEESNFSYIFSFDLHAHEANQQDDKVFADAIFAFDQGYKEELPISLNVKENKRQKDLSWVEPKFMDVQERDRYSSKSEIKEEIKHSGGSFSKIGLKKSTDAELLRVQKTEMLKKALGLSDSVIREKPSELDEESIEVNSDSDKEKKPSSEEMKIIDLFKSSSKYSKIMTDRKGDSVILKLTKS